MNIVKIISEHKNIKKEKPLKRDYKRVEAIVMERGIKRTRHIDIEIT